MLADIQVLLEKYKETVSDETLSTLPPTISRLVGPLLRDELDESEGDLRCPGRGGRRGGLVGAGSRQEQDGKDEVTHTLIWNDSK